MSAQKEKDTSKVAFHLNPEDASKLDAIKAHYGIPKAMAARFAIRAEYDRISKEEVA